METKEEKSLSEKLEALRTRVRKNMYAQRQDEAAGKTAIGRAEAVLSYVRSQEFTAQQALEDAQRNHQTAKDRARYSESILDELNNLEGIEEIPF